MIHSLCFFVSEALMSCGVDTARSCMISSLFCSDVRSCPYQDVPWIYKVKHWDLTGFQCHKWSTNKTIWWFLASFLYTDALHLTFTGALWQSFSECQHPQQLAQNDTRTARHGLSAITWKWSYNNWYKLGIFKRTCLSCVSYPIVCICILYNIFIIASTHILFSICSKVSAWPIWPTENSGILRQFQEEVLKSQH